MFRLVVTVLLRHPLTNTMHITQVGRNPLETADQLFEINEPKGESEVVYR